jgi:Glycosyltransferase family 87
MPRFNVLRRAAATPQSLPPLQLAIPIVVAAWAVVFEGWRFVTMVQSQPANNDYRLFFLAAKAGVTWGWPHMYDPARLALLNQSFGTFGSSDISPLYTYLNPPLLAWLIAIVTPLPFAVGLYIWTALNILALGAACGLMFGRTRSTWALAFLGSLAVWPTAFAIERGQPELLFYALVVASWWCVQRGQQRWAGVLLGLAGCLKPQDMILLPAVYLICGFPRTMLWWLATTAFAVGVFAAVLGPTGMGTYLGVMERAASEPNFTAAPFISPFGTPFSLLVGQGLLVAIALFGVWMNRRSLRVALAIGIVGTLTSAVHLHEYDYVGLIVAAWLATEGPVSALDLAWIGAGILSAQLPAIGIRTAILIWQPLWLGFLAVRAKLPMQSRVRRGRILSAKISVA